MNHVSGPITAISKLNNAVWYEPFVPAANTTIDRLGIQQNNAVSCAYKLAIHSNSATNTPDTQLGTVTLAASAATGYRDGALGSTINLIAGQVYWLAVINSVTISLPGVAQGSVYSSLIAPTANTVLTASNVNRTAGLFAVGTYAAGPPATVGTLFANNEAVSIWARTT